jgi:endo-1,4-beta-xylanase
VAYRAAAAADPAAMLVLNEMAIEDGSAEAELKRRALLRLLERERGAGTPIHALGIQSHLDAARQPRTNPGLRAFLREVTRMGLPVLITELDVADYACPRDRSERDRAVADVYRAYLGLVLDEAQVLAVTTWGLSDNHTWLSDFRPRPDGAAVRPLPLDRAFRRKPAWHAIAAALARE